MSFNINEKRKTTQMYVQSINAYNTQPNFNSRLRVDQKKKIVFYRQKPVDNLHLAQILPSIKYYTQGNEISAVDRTYDSFTGMRDKKYCLATLANRIDACKKHKRNLSIAMFDMDNFKSVNELLGYETGDKFIKTIGKNISKVAIEQGLSPYRFGGDEFIVIFNNQTAEEQKEIADRITAKINNDPIIKSKEQEYHTNSLVKLLEYGSSNRKISELLSLKSKKSILDEVHENLTTEVAKNDPFLINTIVAVNKEIKSHYSDLIQYSLKEEKNEKTRNWLQDISNRFDSKYPPSQQEEKELDEYLLSIYDKSTQIYQIKKWISDFQQNNGFSVSGGVVTFTPDSLEGKSPIDLINDAGEVLKQGKNTKKGSNYTQVL